KRTILAGFPVGVAFWESGFFIMSVFQMGSSCSAPKERGKSEPALKSLFREPNVQKNEFGANPPPRAN
ncbi:hypothetical protein, partial [Thermococcus sp.]|uniref:hypothetical protein n=1 Tax=Thermococcus sp. TaxID=35749 RepID=UPI00262F5E62